MDKLDAVRKSVAVTSGDRPHFFDNPDTDRLLAMILALSGELATVYERLDSLERVLERSGHLDRAAVEAFRPDDAATTDRMAWNEALVERVLRVISYELNTLRKQGAAA